MVSNRIRTSLRLIAAMALALSSSPLSAATVPDRIITLDETTKLAANNSQLLLYAREDEEIALQRVRESMSLFFPKLDLGANWSKFHVEGDRPFLIQPGLGSTLLIDNPRENYYTLRASIYQSVYEGGRSRNLWRQARISLERAKTGREAMQIKVETEAKKAFYDLLLAQEKRRLYVDTLQRLEPMFRQETSSPLATMRLERARLAWRSAAASSAAAEQESKFSYLKTLNLELSTKVSLQGKLETQPIELDLQKMLAWSNQYRAELRQTEYQEQLDALGISLSLAERVPTVALGATYERTGADIELPTFNWAGTLSVNLPVSISNFIYGWAKVRERKAQYRQATLKHAETADQIELQVRQAYERYRHYQTELLSRQEEKNRMMKALEQIRRERFSLSDRLEAEQIALDSLLSYLEAVHGHLQALTDLEAAIGHSLPTS